jgi:hypothetical protein
MACETQDAAFAGIHAEFVRQQAEIAKLRAALEEIAHTARRFTRADDRGEDVWRRRLAGLARIASAALEPR